MRDPNISEPLAVYSSLLGGDVGTVISRVRLGISFQVFSYISGLMSFSLAEWASFLHLSDRSMQRYRKGQKNFDTLQSEKIIEISLLHKRGVDLFGTTHKFEAWLASPLVSLGGDTPKSFLDNSFGIQLINSELGRLEHGVLA